MRLKIGVVGAGGIAVESHLPVLRSLRNVEKVAICDNRIDIAKEAASARAVRHHWLLIFSVLLLENRIRQMFDVLD